MNEKKGVLIILSGPSGSGKDTILGELVSRNDNVRVSISMTTRKMRQGETDGVHYYFVTREYFEKKIKEGSMLEYAEYAGNYYGTPLPPMKAHFEAGENVVIKKLHLGGTRMLNTQQCYRASKNNMVSRHT